MDDLAKPGAGEILGGFEAWQREFDGVTRRARRRFEECDWRGIQTDALTRLDLYSKAVRLTLESLRTTLGSRVADRSLWKAVRRAYASRLAERRNPQLAETFFNSVARRIFSTVGVDSEVEFVGPESAPEPSASSDSVFEEFVVVDGVHRVVRELLDFYRFHVDYEDPDRDARLVAAEVDRYLLSILGSDRVDSVETVRSVFFRNKGAYIIGRIRSHRQVIPLVLPLLNTERGIVVDAALMSGAEVSIVFSFTRSYFHVEVERPHELIVFLKSIMPLKPVAELYNSIGFNRHGKTELYRSLRRHLESTPEKFEIARGDPGMVMIVFTLPFYDVVFKVIRDRFPYPKSTTRRQVMERYRLVFERDRVGRLVDAQEFEHLEFERDRFSGALIRELAGEASSSVSIDSDRVVVHHLYAERKLTPLNLYLKDWSESAARDAVIDYGRSIKDLAAANIFPGDFLLKNFGVTRHGRVVFYDYDELCPLTECRFRELPPPRFEEEELADEPQFTVAEEDVFPEEFEKFLGLPESLRRVFEVHHEDLFTTEFWRRMQRRHAANEIMDVYPYPASRRLRHRAGG